MPLGLVHIGIARPDDLVHRRNCCGAERHRGNRLGAANPEYPVSTGQMAARNHRLMRGRRQAGNDLINARHHRRHNGHHRRRQQWVAPTGNVTTNPLDRDDLMAKMQAGQRLNFQWQHGSVLRFGEGPHAGNGKFGVGAGLWIKGCNRCRAFFRGNLKRRHIGLVEQITVVPQGRIAIGAHGGQNPRNRVAQRPRIAGRIVVRRLDVEQLALRNVVQQHGLPLRIIP